MKKKNIAARNVAKKNPAGAPVSIVNQQIDVRPFHRGGKDTTSWRNAIQSAESRIPKRTLLYDLYADVVFDDQVQAVTSKRRDAVTTANWQFLDANKKPVEAINEIIDSIGFETILEEIVNSKFWGYSIIEPSFFKTHAGTWEVSPFVVPKLNMRPHLGIIAEDAFSDEGINLRKGIYAKTIMEVGKVDDLGLLVMAAPYSILKRGGLGDYAMFVQVFGNPLVDATWDGYDESQRLKLLEAIKALGAGGAMVRPAGTTMDLKDKQSNANGDLQVKFIGTCDKGISKSLLGTTETTEASSSSGYAQSKTHENQDNKKHVSDTTFTRRILNSRFTKILEAAGFDLKGGKFSIKGEDEKISKKELIEIHDKLKNKLKLPISDDFLYETYGVPKPDNYAELKKAQEMESLPTEEPPNPKDPPKDLPKKKPTKDKEVEDSEVKLTDQSVWEKLKSFFVSAPTQDGANLACCGETHMIKLSETDDFKALIEAVTNAKGKGYCYPELFDYNIDPLSQAFESGWKNEELVQLTQKGIAYGMDDPKMMTAWEMNLFKFSAVKAAYQSAEVNALFRRSKNYGEFETMVKKLYGIGNKNHLRTEYNTAYQVGQSASTYYRLLAQIETFSYWEYRTIGDGRVRKSHERLHGRILPANHALWKKIFPPNDWNCRCYIVPRMTGEVDQSKVAADIAFIENFLATSPAWEKAIKNGFGINRADTMEVFTESQQYSKTPQKVLEHVGQMTAADWKLKILLTRQQEAIKTHEPSVHRKVIDVFKEKHLDGQQLNLPDYADRSLHMDLVSFEKQVQQSKRHYYLNEIENVLRHPDEVWVNNASNALAFNSYVYLKYYKNEIIKVIAQVTSKGDLKIVSWQPISKSLDTSRRGLLIRKWNNQ